MSQWSLSVGFPQKIPREDVILTAGYTAVFPPGFKIGHHPIRRWQFPPVSLHTDQVRWDSLFSVYKHSKPGEDVHAAWGQKLSLQMSKEHGRPGFFTGCLLICAAVVHGGSQGMSQKISFNQLWLSPWTLLVCNGASTFQVDGRKPTRGGLLRLWSLLSKAQWRRRQPFTVFWLQNRKLSLLVICYSLVGTGVTQALAVNVFARMCECVCEVNGCGPGKGHLLWISACLFRTPAGYPPMPDVLVWPLITSHYRLSEKQTATNCKILVWMYVCHCDWRQSRKNMVSRCIR